MILVRDYCAKGQGVGWKLAFCRNSPRALVEKVKSVDVMIEENTI